ncbi:hypothetical protein [Branchiibius sp. NY16-3462-2]|uniref:hypothetical protein n=1 Tax=Branchiibius sp. NY16-3462-2 TaxID=1807500 RepID=UPI0007959EE4|nr:hypothetical protein [Branchiibius sp. NY16-3462-2]KYH43706.1 hypothetical protein AZH51_02565 [Branchiibius sp. NY16-3462-2]
MDISRGLAGAADAAAQGQGALPQQGLPEVGSGESSSLLVQPNSPVVASTTEPAAQDVDLSLYEPVAGPRAHQAAKILMVLFGALAALLIVGFGVVLFASGLPDAISEFFK